MISFEFHFEKWHEKTQKPLWFLGFPNRYLFRFALLVAGKGLEPSTSGLWARRATNCSTPRRHVYIFYGSTLLKMSPPNLYYRQIGAGDRGRTGTIGKDRRILSPVRLPIPPLRQKNGSKGGARTHSLSVNSRVLHHWATLEQRLSFTDNTIDYTLTSVRCQVQLS